MRELSWLAVPLGVIIGALLGAANAFLGLKVGTPISGALLEGDIAQTDGPAGEQQASEFLTGIQPRH